MKSTGIVRRLDELGRIVVPREFRKMYRLNVGDPIEINAAEDGSIILRKLNIEADLTAICNMACDTLAVELGHTVAASTSDKFVCASGSGRTQFIGSELIGGVAKFIKDKRSYSGTADNEEEGVKLNGFGFEYVAFAPIMGAEDVYGGIFTFSHSAILAPELTTLRAVGRTVGDCLQKY